ncbi:hypothetical protein Droror1_Dr00004560 [Drosera rotundifolia]
MNLIKPDLNLGLLSSPLLCPRRTQPSTPRRRLHPPLSAAGDVVGVSEKPATCTADELHYVSIPDSGWSLALWRYLPALHAAKRNHPLLLLSGVGTNAIGYDLSPPQLSFARHMSGQGFDTWTLEVRGAGLSKRVLHKVESSLPINLVSRKELAGRSEGRWSSTNLFGDSGPRIMATLAGQQPVPNAFSELQGRISTFVDNFQKQFDLVVNSSWDLDDCLKQDLPVVMEYIRSVTEPKDGKLLAIGHSMGGILLYAMLSLYGFEGRDPGLAAVITLGSSLDYMPSRSSLNLLQPLAERARTLNLPSIPMGAIYSVIHPLALQPSYLLSWLSSQISVQDVMIPELVEKLYLKNHCTVPAKLLLQLATAFEDGGLRDRNGTFFYKDHLHRSTVPVLALAGDRDLVCPPDAVYETVKARRRPFIAYKVFGDPSGPHYAHYDLVGSRLASKQVYPCIIEFLLAHDAI